MWCCGVSLSKTNKSSTASTFYICIYIEGEGEARTVYCGIITRLTRFYNWFSPESRCWEGGRVRGDWAPGWRGEERDDQTTSCCWPLGSNIEDFIRSISSQTSTQPGRVRTGRTQDLVLSCHNTISRDLKFCEQREERERERGDHNQWRTRVQHSSLIISVLAAVAGADTRQMWPVWIWNTTW